MQAEFFPAKQKWPDAIEDLSTIDPDSEVIRLAYNIKSLEALKNFKSLKRLSCINPEKNTFKTICECRTLEALHVIKGNRADDILPLENLAKLKTLSLEYFKKPPSLDVLKKLPFLENLYIEDNGKITDITPLSALTNLRQLGLAGGMYKIINFESLAPVSSLTKLEYFLMAGVRILDGSLQPLKNLKKLKLIHLPNFFSTEEFASLASSLPDTECEWFKPYSEMSSISTCKKCGKNDMVMLTGTSKGRKSYLCKNCDSELLDQHIQRFKALH